MFEEGISRRELFRRGGQLGTVLALPALLPLEAQAHIASTDAAGALAARHRCLENGRGADAPAPLEAECSAVLTSGAG